MTKNRHETDVAFIQALADLLQTNDLSELEVRREYGENDGLNVRVTRQSAVVAPVVAAAPAAPAPAPVAAATSAPAPAAPAAEENPADHPGAVNSPMVGTAYLQPEPGASAFIAPGKTVSKGQTLLIVEAMKTMNHIPAPRDGVVSRILIEDGEPVEFGTPLVILD
ncbi:MAG: acetyl-CoA carboxylase biotin carboxyl carrier protein [Mangrovicoccus sp.]|nr:acetyl-CoA carboxylase biotin carboxyl carrier protein [Mangrovicoccus sp.]